MVDENGCEERWSRTDENTSNRTDVESDSHDVVLLHVGDDQRQTELVSSYLERLNRQFRVFSETDPTSALERLRHCPVDYVVVDDQVPGTARNRFVRAVRETRLDVPVFPLGSDGTEEVVSGNVDAETASSLQKRNPDPYERLAYRIEDSVERRRSSRRARVSRGRLLELYEATDGFYILDTDWTVTYWNHRIADQTGIPSRDILGKTFWDVFPEVTETGVHEEFRAAMTATGATEFDVYYHVHGRCAEVRTYPVDEGLFVRSREKQGDTDRSVESERRNRTIQPFVSLVSHDLRSPLNVAKGRLQMARETGDLEHLAAVAEAHDRMGSLIDELLRSARDDELELSEVSLQAVAEKAWKTVFSWHTVLVVETDLVLEANESELRRLFENLFWNAVDHGDATTVRVGCLGGDEFFVEDDGTGIPTDERDSVFESGFSTKDDGSGFGLPIVSGIVEDHGWEVELVESEAGGARFEVRGIQRVNA